MSTELFALLVPVNKQRLLFPRTAVREIVRYMRPTEIPNSPNWLRGTINWQGKNIPLVSFEGLCGHPIPDDNSRTRIAVLTALDERIPHRSYAIYVQGFPQLIGVKETDLKVDSESRFPADSPIVSQLRLFNDRPQIPNLAYIENQILSHL